MPSTPTMTRPAAPSATSSEEPWSRVHLMVTNHHQVDSFSFGRPAVGAACKDVSAHHITVTKRSTGDMATSDIAACGHPPSAGRQGGFRDPVRRHADDGRTGTSGPVRRSQLTPSHRHGNSSLRSRTSSIRYPTNLPLYPSSERRWSVRRRTLGLMERWLRPSRTVCDQEPEGPSLHPHNPPVSMPGGATLRGRFSTVPKRALRA